MSKGFLFLIPVIAGVIAAFSVPATWHRPLVGASVALGGSILFAIGIAVYNRFQKNNDQEPGRKP